MKSVVSNLHLLHSALEWTESELLLAALEQTAVTSVYKWSMLVITTALNGTPAVVWLGLVHLYPGRKYTVTRKAGSWRVRQVDTSKVALCTPLHSKVGTHTTAKQRWLSGVITKLLAFCALWQWNTACPLILGAPLRHYSLYRPSGFRIRDVW